MIDWLPRTDLTLALLCERWLEVLQDAESVEKYNFDREECEATVVKIKAYAVAWAKFEMVDSTVNRVVKNGAKKEAKAAMRGFARSSIRFNCRMDEGLKESLGITAGEVVRTLHPRPVSQPYTLVELTGGHFEHRVKALRREGHRAKKPMDAFGVRFAWQVGGERPGSGEELPKTRFSRRSVQVLTFSEADAGKMVWYATCYENAKGESGPWSPVTECRVW